MVMPLGGHFFVDHLKLDFYSQCSNELYSDYSALASLSGEMPASGLRLL